MHLRGRGEVALHLDLASSAVARRAFALLRAFDVDSEIRTYQQHAFDRADPLPAPCRGLAARLRDAAPRRACSTRSHRPLERPPQRVLARRCCRGAYLRGALLGAGSLSGPRDPHLEIRTAEAEGARFLAEVAAREGAELQLLDRGRHAVAYAKGIEPIADALVAAGATDTVLVLEESSVLSAIRADANRLANADHANLVRTSRAAHAQLEAVRRLDLDGAARRPARARAAAAAASDRVDRRARVALQAAAHESVRVPAAAASRRARRGLAICNSSRPAQSAVVILDNGGSALVRRRIQTPSVATVSGVVQGPGGSSSELPGPPACPSAAPRLRYSAGRRATRVAR